MAGKESRKAIWVLGGLVAAMLAAVAGVWLAVLRQDREQNAKGGGDTGGKRGDKA